MKNVEKEIILRYKNENGNIRIFGEEFVKKNKNNCKINFNGEEKELNSSIFNNYSGEKDNIEIKLKIYKDINDMSYMFYNCIYLQSFNVISIWNLNNVTNINSMFYNCNSLTFLSDISKWNINKVNNMSSVFYNCESLKSLPDISKWNINNVTDMSNFFIIVNL